MSTKPETEVGFKSKPRNSTMEQVSRRLETMNHIREALRRNNARLSTFEEPKIDDNDQNWQKDQLDKLAHMLDKVQEEVMRAEESVFTRTQSSFNPINRQSTTVRLLEDAKQTARELSDFVKGHRSQSRIISANDKPPDERVQALANAILNSDLAWRNHAESLPDSIQIVIQIVRELIEGTHDDNWEHCLDCLAQEERSLRRALKNSAANYRKFPSSNAPAAWQPVRLWLNQYKQLKTEFNDAVYCTRELANELDGFRIVQDALDASMIEKIDGISRLAASLRRKLIDSEQAWEEISRLNQMIQRRLEKQSTSRNSKQLRNYCSHRRYCLFW